MRLGASRMVMCGAARQPRHGWVAYGAMRYGGHGKACSGWAGHVVARHGRHGWVRFVLIRIGSAGRDWHGVVRTGEDWRGQARQARMDVARIGKVGIGRHGGARKSRRGVAGRGPARLGMADKARPVSARLGMVRQARHEYRNDPISPIRQRRSGARAAVFGGEAAADEGGGMMEQPRIGPRDYGCAELLFWVWLLRHKVADPEWQKEVIQSARQCRKISDLMAADLCWAFGLEQE